MTEDQVTDDQTTSDEVISTRQLVDIYKAFTIFGDINKAVEKSIERYEDEIIDGFSELWTLIHEKGGVNEYPEQEQELPEAEWN